MTNLIAEFVAELPARIRELELAVTENDAANLLRLVRALKGQGGCQGFEIITEAAAKIEAALLGGESTGTVREDCEWLVRLCMRARPPVRDKRCLESAG